MKKEARTSEGQELTIRNAEAARAELSRAHQALSAAEDRRTAFAADVEAAQVAVDVASRRMATGDFAVADDELPAASARLDVATYRLKALEEHGLPACRTALEAARTQEAEAAGQASRCAVYAEAVALRESAIQRFNSEYLDLVSGLAALAGLFAEAQAACSRANECLPEGCGPLADPEAELRDLPAKPSIVVGEEEDERSVFEDDLQLVPDHYGPRHRFSGRPEAASWRHAGGQKPMRKIVKRPFRVRHILSGLPAFPGPRLRDLVLPGLTAGEAPYLGEPTYADTSPQRFERVEITPLFDAPERGLAWSQSTHRWVAK